MSFLFFLGCPLKQISFSRFTLLLMSCVSILWYWPQGGNACGWEGNHELSSLPPG